MRPYDQEADESDDHDPDCDCWMCESEQALVLNYSSSEADRIELWRTFEFVRLGFNGEQIAQLLEWEISPADARKVMERDGERTACSPELAMKILDCSPVPVSA
jgi:hypothetical protein